MKTRGQKTFFFGSLAFGVLIYLDVIAEGEVLEELDAEIISAASYQYNDIPYPAVAELASGQKLGVECDASSVGDKVVIRVELTNILRRKSYRCDYSEFSYNS